MTFYRKSFRKASRDNFARSAVFAEFRRKHAVALDYDGFVDRRPHEQPRPVLEAWRRETRTPAQRRAHLKLEAA